MSCVIACAVLTHHELELKMHLFGRDFQITSSGKLSGISCVKADSA